jgi:UDP-N-acetylglucosamine--N-acetylmuramyl-(pentapeptide) pyrophosphoryl-undecaprenol N-acetylglucosamine transferase
LIAALRGKPLVLMNADAALLLSNKILRPLANKILFGLPPENKAPTDKEIVTGNAIRNDICQLPRPQERYAARSGMLRILVVGGSLGAKVLNETIPAAIALMAEADWPKITHQSGKTHIDGLRARYMQLGIGAEVIDFINDMPERYADADLVICRAGAITVSELTAAGVASILIPFIASSTSHQIDNARWMAKLGAAMYLPQQELNPKNLANILQKMTRERCAQMAELAYSSGQREASQTIANILEKLV